LSRRSSTASRAPARCTTIPLTSVITR
jgi:hypothetical protein